ncbi:hypothetical protein FQA39_LY06210 [Lamprigera yunnana]|nr:hypothetical protein FQA39_LY06210 [Lamprigera yunnana]
MKDFKPIDSNYILKDKLDEISKFTVRDNDIFLLGYPKSGTTWAQEMIWLVANDLNYKGAKVFVDERFPVLEMFMYRSSGRRSQLECYVDSMKFIENLKDGRCIKSHLKSDYLPEQLLKRDCNAKIIYIARNPKDVAVSSYMFHKELLQTVEYSFEEYCELFMTDLYVAFGQYWQNVLYFWNKRNETNILFIKYEDMKRDLLEVIRKIAKFLNKCHTEEEEIELMNWLSFEKMKENEYVNHNDFYGKPGFIRCGNVGDHKSKMSADLLSKFDEWIKKNVQNTNYDV